LLSYAAKPYLIKSGKKNYYASNYHKAAAFYKNFDFLLIIC
jgi:hypothetical protein